MELVEIKPANFRITIREVKTGLSKTLSIKDGKHSLIDIYNKLVEVFRKKSKTNNALMWHE